MKKSEIVNGYKLIKRYNPCDSLLDLPFTTPETVLRRLSWLRYSGYTYSKINALDEFSKVPPGTLQVMYECGGEYFPKKHKSFFRCRPDNPRNRCSINLDNPESAARSIKNHSSDRKYIQELIEHLKK